MTTRDPAARVALVALTATTAIQIFTSLAVATPAVLAPALAPDLGITPQWIGVFIGLVYTGAMLGSLAAGGFIAQWGSIRLSQICVLLCTVGIALVGLLPGSAAALLVAAAFLLGLGYGPITPASSAVLIRTTPPARMALMFSIKQTGVPAGAALAGAVMPGVALLFGWRSALVGLAVVGLLVIAAAEPTRRALDTARTAGQSFSLKALLGPLRTVLAARELRALSLMGFAFASVQVCLSSFLVIFLFDTLGWSLVSAGLALTCATISAVVARILWGMVSDRWLGPGRVLALIGVIATLCGVLLASAGPGWPTWTILVVAALYGASAIGWNGVMLAELARLAPPGSAGAVTGASGFVTFGGVMAGPPVFAGLAAASGSYRTGFFAAALVSGIAAATLILHSRRKH
jgi:MFS family permease